MLCIVLHDLQRQQRSQASPNLGSDGDTQLFVLAYAGAFCADGQATVGDEDSCIILPEWTIRCGPRKTIYFDPKQASRTRAPQRCLVKYL